MRQQSITDYYSAVGRFPQQSTTDYFQSAVQGLGALVSTPPIVAASRMLKRNGVGAAGDSSDGVAQLAALGIVLLGVTGVLAYQAGKAMAPTPADRTMWGWIGVPVGVFTGAWGLGTMGIISNVKKG